MFMTWNTEQQVTGWTWSPSEQNDDERQDSDVDPSAAHDPRHQPSEDSESDDEDVSAWYERGACGDDTSMSSDILRYPNEIGTQVARLGIEDSGPMALSPKVGSWIVS